MILRIINIDVTFIHTWLMLVPTKGCTTMDMFCNIV